MAQPVLSNDLLKLAAKAVRDKLNGNTWLHLFANSPVLSPPLPLNFFWQSNFPGYSPLNVAGLWTDVVKAEDGRYAFTLPLQSFTATADGGQFCRGWYLSQGGLVLLAKYLETAVQVTAGVVIEIGIELSDLALS